MSAVLLDASVMVDPFDDDDRHHGSCVDRLPHGQAFEVVQ